MPRILFALLALLSLAAPARADDISAAGRGVVRVVVVAFEDGEVSNFGHGSGFAVTRNRIVTNAHVVAAAAQAPKDELVVGVVPSEGARAFRARLVAIDPARDLALVELEEGSIPPIALYTGPLEDGSAVAALGYPGNVDLATAQSAEDYITPLPPTRSTGIFSNLRPINGIATLLHTADIARGHSGGPLLDPCGRVLGVNTLITVSENGDAGFGFAVANRELTAFLRQAQQPFNMVSTECVSMSDRLREDRDRAAAEEAARRAEAALRAQRTREAELNRIDESREARLALAVLLLVLSLVGFGGAGVMLLQHRQRPALLLGSAGAVLLIAAVAVFLSRPSRGDLAADVAEVAAETNPDRFAGRNLCRLVPERSRVTISSTDPVPLTWTAAGCVNGRTQYARTGNVWTRVLVPDEEQAVSVLEFSPASGEYVVTRFLLNAAAMDRARALRDTIELKTCSRDPEARTILANRQRDILGALPSLPNERLVYRCEPRRAGG